MFRYLVVLWFGACALGLCPSSRAQAQATPASAASVSLRDRDAKRMFELGRASLEAGRFEAAAGFFEEAYVLSGRPELLFNIGTAFDRLRRDDEAARYFERYLVAAPDADNALAVEARLRVLKQRRAFSPESESSSSSSPAVPTPNAPASPPPDEGSGMPRSTKVLWSVLGVAAVAGGVVAVVLLTRDGNPREEGPLVGSRGAVAQALASF